MLESLRRDVPHYNAVRLALERVRQERRDTPLIVPHLSERAQRMDVTVLPHRLNAYDALQTLAKDSEDCQATETDEDTQ